VSYPDRRLFATFPSGGRPGLPRQFSLSLLCSVVLHAAFAVVLLQDVRLPSVEVVRDVFLTPEWTEPAARA
jgi:hypothetical protein